MSSKNVRMASLMVISQLCGAILYSNGEQALSLARVLGSNEPELWMNVSQIIERWGYPAQVHEVVTGDGYILTMQRIPHGRNNSHIQHRPVVFLMHGLEGCSSNWVVNLPHQSAAFIYADAGYDVWLGNVRGNTYGKRHIHYNKHQRQFWRFTWDEVVRYDLPALLNKALEISEQDSLYLVAHSQGTLTTFARLPQDRELAKKIKIMFALSPITQLAHLEGLLKWVAIFSRELKLFTALVGYNEFTPNNLAMKLMAKFVCGHKWSNPLCSNIIFLLAGPDGNQLNETRIPVFVAHSPAGTSTQNMIHFGQMVNSGEFQHYDFWNSEKNWKIYNQSKPPPYTLNGFNTPIYLFSGSNDILSTPTDVEILKPELTNLKGHLALHDFNHFDFIWGLRATDEVYQPILTAMKQYDDEGTFYQMPIPTAPPASGAASDVFSFTVYALLLPMFVILFLVAF